MVSLCAYNFELASELFGGVEWNVFNWCFRLILVLIFLGPIYLRSDVLGSCKYEIFELAISASSQQFIQPVFLTLLYGNDSINLSTISLLYNRIFFFWI